MFLVIHIRKTIKLTVPLLQDFQVCTVILHLLFVKFLASLGAVWCSGQIRPLGPKIQSLFFLTQTAVGQYDQGVRLTVAQSFLAPGLDGYGSFRLLYV